jgi:hypothetical protein
MSDFLAFVCCLIVGHDPYLIETTVFVVCKRCTAAGRIV